MSGDGLIGLVGGLYNLVKQSLRAVHEAQDEDKARTAAADDEQGS